MASINGIQIKGLKAFRDHEGATIFQGNVYYRGKKLGFWSQDSWGGCDNYDFKEIMLNEEVDRFRNSSMVESQYKAIANLDILLYELVKLMDIEKAYKKAVKKGYKSYVEACDGYHIKGYYTRSNDKKAIKNSEFYAKFVDDCKKVMFKDWDGKVSIYTSPDDFIVEV